MYKLLFLLLSGCMTSEVLYVDSRFTPTEVVDIQAASDEWYRATGQHVDLAFGSSLAHDRVMIRVESEAELTDEERSMYDGNPCYPGHGGTAALTKIYDGPFGVTGERLTVLMSCTSPEFFRRLVMHEFGHHLGLTHMHSSDPRALMYYDGINAECVTYYDAVLWCTRWKCDPETINYCGENL